ncbi:MAG: hypothetical protein C0601_04675 [Candidatus Muiribacterium halophilum]|uniref:Uncharacterized protein n=1 Tax=Muiribacterium halophilum TaxID=2053465 RepID=A0A2N5ZI03_MUIH1|nr:MAG: hypothetical protein C0601_04675 [Candidatus Muirbacterium halophilum]
MKKTLFITSFIVLIGMLLIGCGGGGGGDDFGSGNITNNISGTDTTVSTKISSAKTYINNGTTSSYSQALTELQALENDPNFSPTPEQKNIVKTGIKYCQIKLESAQVTDSSTSAYFEQIISNANGTPVPDDTYFLLAACYSAQEKTSDAVTIMETMTKQGTTIVNSNYSYDSEFGIGTYGDAHAFLALLYYTEGNTTKAAEQKALAESKGVSNLGSTYLSNFGDIGL